MGSNSETKNDDSSNLKSNLKTEEKIEEIENTLKEDFENLDFNKYLDDQPGANYIDDGRRCKIIILNVSHHFSLRAIRNLCREFGDVCSIVKGPQYTQSRTGYYFVTYGKLDEAQQAIEQINRMCKPMRAEYSIPRQKYDYKRIEHDSKDRNKIEPVKVMMESRNFRGPFTEKYDFKFPTQQIGITLEYYESNNLSKVDPTLNFFNDKVLYDIFRSEEDVKKLESATQSHKLENFIWTYKMTDEDTTKIQKFLSTSAGTYDEDYDIHSKRNDKFEKLLGKYGNCTTCNNLTTRMSKQSEKFYCSIACQQKKSDDLNDTNSCTEDFKISIKEFTRKTNVIITAVISQNTIYVRSNDTETTIQYNKILQEVMISCQDAPVILKAPNVGDIVGVRILDRIYYRSIVLRIEDCKKIRVALLDTGEVTVVNMTQLCKLPQKLYFLPIYARKIVLTDVPTNYINIKAVKLLIRLGFQKNEQELLLKFDETFKVARLYQRDLCINNELTKIITIKEPQESRYQVDTISAFPLKKLSSVQLLILDNSMLINAELSCVPLEYLEKLENLHRKVQCYGNSLKLKEDYMYTPLHNEVCLFRLDGIWYRAACFEAVGDQHPTMQSLDFGFFTMIHVSNIVKIPKQLLDKCFTHDFCIEGKW